MLTGDVRNDIYVTLMQGELRRGAGGKVADKNIEVTITVCNQDGEIIPVIIIFMLHQTHEMQTFAIGTLLLSRGFLTSPLCAEMAERIKIPFGVNTLEGSGNIV